MDKIRKIKNLKTDLETLGLPFEDNQQDILDRADEMLSDYIEMLRAIKVVKAP